ncbi:hypothetical protein QE357_004239 [Siphonobacter sp. BAB-5404]|nr:hypothetical protein [Siphonobacter sp. SORGH_AS_0500]
MDREIQEFEADGIKIKGSYTIKEVKSLIWSVHLAVLSKRLFWIIIISVVPHFVPNTTLARMLTEWILKSIK